MFKRLRQIFSSSSEQIPDEAREFVTKLAAANVWILAVGLRGTPAMPADKDAAFEVIAAHRIDVSEIGDDDSVFPFNFARDGKQFLPFFTSKERAERFVRNSPVQTDLATVYQPYALLAGFVATHENEIFELVVDAGSEGERTIGMAERLLLRSLSKPMDENV